MVKSKSMEVVKAVSEDLTEVKETLGQYTAPLGQAVAPIKRGGGIIKNTIKVRDTKTNDMFNEAVARSWMK